MRRQCNADYYDKIYYVINSCTTAEQVYSFINWLHNINISEFSKSSFLFTANEKLSEITKAS